MTETSWPLTGELPSTPAPVRPPNPETVLTFEQLHAHGIQATIAFHAAYPEQYARLKTDFQYRLERPKTFSGPRVAK